MEERYAGMELEVAKFILSIVDTWVADEITEDEHLQYLVHDLQDIKDSNIYYYLCNACERHLREKNC